MPIRYRMKRVVRAHEIHAQPDPPDEMVWDMCVDTRRRGDGDMRCEGCPKWEDDPTYGKVQSMCYVRAKEVCKLAMAWPMRLSGH